MANILKGRVIGIIDAVYAVVQDESLRPVLSNIGSCDVMVDLKAMILSIFPVEFPQLIPVPGWTEVVLLPKTFNMVIAMSQRVFVREPQL